MTEHPITPPPDLVQQWRRSGPADAAANNAYERHIATQAAQWGADQELEACVNYIDNNMSGNKAREFRAIRRPKPPSLKEQALQILDVTQKGWGLAEVDLDTLRRALEQLDD